MYRPVSYREELIGPLARLIGGGECSSVVGMSGVGKTNVIQHLQRPEVLAHHLGVESEQPLFVLVDSNGLPDWSPWGLYEGWLAALACAPGLDEAMRAPITRLHAEVLAQPGHYPLAVRHCAAALARLCAARPLVTIFDEFDPLFVQLPPIALRNLRGLRDQLKYRLSFITFTRQPLTALRDAEDWDAIEPFVELLTAAEFGLRPLRPQDAADEVARIGRRLGHEPPPKTCTRIATLSGGHPALIRALVYRTLQDASAQALDLALLLRDPVIRLECLKIWDQLSDEEQDAVRVLFTGEGQATLGEMREGAVLHLKGVTSHEQRPDQRLFSPLFERFVRGLYAAPEEGEPPISVDPERRQARYYGIEIGGDLSEREFRLLSYLYSRYGAICSLAEVEPAVYPGERPVTLDEGTSLEQHDFERLRVLARRLRQRLDGLAPNQPRLFTILKGRGYRLGFPHQQTAEDGSAE